MVAPCLLPSWELSEQNTTSLLCCAIAISYTKNCCTSNVKMFPEIKLKYRKILLVVDGWLYSSFFRALTITNKNSDDSIKTIDVGYQVPISWTVGRVAVLRVQPMLIWLVAVNRSTLLPFVTTIVSVTNRFKVYTLLLPRSWQQHIILWVNMSKTYYMNTRHYGSWVLWLLSSRQGWHRWCITNVGIFIYVKSGFP